VEASGEIDPKCIDIYYYEALVYHYATKVTCVSIFRSFRQKWTTGPSSLKILSRCSSVTQSTSFKKGWRKQSIGFIRWPWNWLLARRRFLTVPKMQCCGNSPKLKSDWLDVCSRTNTALSSPLTAAQTLVRWFVSDRVVSQWYQHICICQGGLHYTDAKNTGPLRVRDGSVVADVQRLGGNILTLSEQRYFVCDTSSQNTKGQDMLKIWGHGPLVNAYDREWLKKWKMRWLPKQAAEQKCFFPFWKIETK